ncbi:MAG TPA: F0F1 ATP synthase subunit B [Bacteroidia bacterium]|jgi:F-type H+-transporting ATPase subunit b|nr:F0F1 ATP synthase subunit B [Bacteroidia bacterium]
MIKIIILNSLATPSIGLIFWTTVIFVLLLFLLSKYAWKPILSAIKSREQNIENALKEAQKAKEEIQKLKSDNEKLLQQARLEYDNIVKEAREIKEKMIAQAKDEAQKEAQKILKNAQETINAQKSAAIAEIKQQVASLSIEIASKILKKELSNSDTQKQLVNQMLEEVSLN